MIQMGAEVNHGSEIRSLGPRLAQGGFGYKEDYEVIPINGKMRIWIEFQHAPHYPIFARRPHNWITDPERLYLLSSLGLITYLKSMMRAVLSED